MFLSKNLIRILKVPLKNNKQGLLLSIVSIIFAAALQMSIPYYLGRSIDKALINKSNPLYFLIKPKNNKYFLLSAKPKFDSAFFFAILSPKIL